MRVILSGDAKESIRKLKMSDHNSAKAVATQIDKLESNPNPPKAKKVRGKTHEYWRLRAGNCRIIYYLEDDLITIVLVEYRKSVYDFN